MGAFLAKLKRDGDWKWKLFRKLLWEVSVKAPKLSFYLDKSLRQSECNWLLNYTGENNSACCKIVLRWDVVYSFASQFKLLPRNHPLTSTVLPFFVSPSLPQMPPHSLPSPLFLLHHRESSSQSWGSLWACPAPTAAHALCAVSWWAGLSVGLSLSTSLMQLT